MTNTAKILLPIVVHHAYFYRGEINIDDYNKWKEHHKDICVTQLRELNKYYNLNIVEAPSIKIEKVLSEHILLIDNTKKRKKSDYMGKLDDLPLMPHTSGEFSISRYHSEYNQIY